MRPPEPGQVAGRPESAAPAPSPPPGRRLRAWWPRARASTRTTPVRLWALTLLCVLTVAGLFGSASVTLDQARGGLDVLEVGAGKQARDTTGLYLRLAAMDADVADILLMGGGDDLGSERQAARERYQTNRAEADEVLLAVASLTGGDDDAQEEGDNALVGDDYSPQKNVHALLANLGAYAQEVDRAFQANEEAQAPRGEVAPEALDAYRSATRLMHTELLPKAFNLGLESSASVRAHHVEGQTSATVGRVGVVASGVLAVGALLGLQVYLRVRFRRRFNAPLLVATVGAVVMTTGIALSLGSSENHEATAKDEGMDPAMALSRAGAIATDMQADQSRYLIDDDRSATYQQVYLERAQQVLFRDVRTLPDYHEKVGEVPDAYPTLPGSEVPDEEDPGTLGYLGADAQEALLRGEDGEVTTDAENELGEVLTTYVAVQEADERMREAIGAGDLDRAIDIRMEVADTENGLFRQHTDALGVLVKAHDNKFGESIHEGRAVLSPWHWVLPVGTLALFALVVVGVRPRLAEYR